MAAPTPSRPVRHWVLTSPSTPTAQMLTLTARVPRPPVACQATLASGPRTVRQGVLTARAPAAIDTFAIPLNTPWPSALTACAPLGTNQHRRNIRHRGRCAGGMGHGPVRAGSPSGRPDCRGRVTWARPGPPRSAGGESGARGSDPASPASDHLSQPARLGRSASRRSLMPRQSPGRPTRQSTTGGEYPGLRPIGGRRTREARASAGSEPGRGARLGVGHIRHRGRCAGRTGHGPVRAGSPSGRPDCRGRVTWARPGPPGSAGGESGARGSDPASPASDHLSQPPDWAGRRHGAV
jgi:hypothetical protein